MSTTPAPGQFGVVRTKGFVGWLIRQGTESQVNHAFVVIDHDGTILEAQMGGAQYANLSKYDGYEIFYSEFALPPEMCDPASLRATAATLRGRPYNFVDIGVITLMTVFGLRWKWLQDIAREEAYLICSQLVDVFFRLRSIILYADGRPTGLVTPGDLAKLLMAGFDRAWTPSESAVKS